MYVKNLRYYRNSRAGFLVAGQASAYRAVEFPNGSWVPDEILTNAGRRLAGHNIYHE